MGAALFPEWEHEMSDTLGAVDPETPAAVEPVATPPETDWQAEAKKWKETSLKIEARANTAAAEAKANAEAARKLKEIEDRDLSEIDRLKRDNEATAADLAELKRQNALLAKGIPHDLIPPVNATADELGEYADRLLAWRGNAAAPATPQPRPDQGQGARPLDPKAQEDTTFAAYDAAFFNPKR